MFSFDKGAGSTAGDDLVFDVTDATFMQDVMEASKTRPILVDFWAPWCGPCKTLGPELEKAVRAAKGKIALAKIDTDKNPMVAGQLRVQSLPTVFAFVNGQPVDGFQGALPGSQIKQFIDQILKMAGADPEADNLEAALEAAEAALAEGAIAEAAQTFAAVLSAEPTELKAIGGLVRCYAAAGEFERARQTLEMAPADKQSDPAIAAAASALSLAEETAGAAADLAKNRAAVAANADDHQARFDLALALIATADNDGAVKELLEIFRRDRTWNDEAAKTQLFKLFEALGPTDPITLSGRRRLSSMIFS